ncbi:transposase family protein [Sulfobacillus thermotolerans]|uniref:transposase family protein n=1 Tax=Sulfobacillus thermotolerans TaxID=338644 RepID=UPI003D2FD796
MPPYSAAGPTGTVQKARPYPPSAMCSDGGGGDALGRRVCIWPNRNGSPALLLIRRNLAVDGRRRGHASNPLDKERTCPMHILPKIPGARCTEITDEGPTIILHFTRTTPTGLCPGCGQAADQIQSHYRRTVSDRPWRGFPVRVELKVRRFCCRNPSCDCEIFCERLDPWVPAYGRRSMDLTDRIEDWGWHLSAEALARSIPPPKFGHLRSLSRGYALGHPISPTGWDWGTGARASPRPCPPVQKSLAFLHFDGHPGRLPSRDSLSHRRRGPKF